MLRMLVFCASLFMASQVCAAPKGAEDPAFQDAVAQWLTGEDDLAALQALGILAKADNRAAQILLAQIAERPNMMAHVTRDMPRKERIALTRAPKGLSGTSWLKIAAEHDPLAKALWESRTPEIRLVTIPALIEAGVHDAALQAAFQSLLYGRGAAVFAELQDAQDRLPSDARYLMLVAGQTARQSNEADAPGAAVLAVMQAGMPLADTLVWRYVSVPQVQERPEVFAAMVDVAPRVRTWAPINRLCREMCPDEPNACTATAVLVGPFQGGQITASPLASVVPNDTYWSSPRATRDMVRAMLDIRTRPWAGSFSACVADQLRQRQVALGVQD